MEPSDVVLDLDTVRFHPQDGGAGDVSKLGVSLGLNGASQRLDGGQQDRGAAVVEAGGESCSERFGPRQSGFKESFGTAELTWTVISRPGQRSRPRLGPDGAGGGW